VESGRNRTEPSGKQDVRDAGVQVSDLKPVTNARKGASLVVVGGQGLIIGESVNSITWRDITPAEGSEK
jgi:hypothetical protein